MDATKLTRIRPAYLLFGVAFLITCVASTYRLSESPGIWYDEGYYTQMAMNVAEHGQEVLQLAPGTYISSATQTAGFPLVAPVALSYRLFGVGVVQGRAVMAIYILLLVLAAALLISAQAREWVGAWSALLLAAFPLVYGNGKSVLGEIPGLFYLLLTLYALHKLEESSYRRFRWYVVAGLSAGLCIATKPIFILITPAIFVVFLMRVRSIPIRWTGFAAALLACAVPIFVWIRLQFGATDTFSHILSFYVNPYDNQHLARSALENARLFITSPTPLFTLVASLAWLGAIVRRLVNRIRIPSAELIGFAFVICIILAFLRLPGWYRYIFPATVMALLYLPLALSELTQLRWPTSATVKTVLMHAVIGSFFLLELFQLGSTSYVAGYYGSHRTRDVASAFGELPRNSTILFYNVPELVILSPSDQYYQYLQPHQTYDAEGYGIEQLSHISDKSVDYIVVMTALYHGNPELFPGYRPAKEANRYTILTRI